jgi:YceI-like domain
MIRADETNAELLVFTFKEGLLSKLAHDLKLKLGKFSLELDGEALAGVFDLSTLKVVSPRRDGVDDAGLMPTRFYAEIEKNAREDVLETRKFPMARLAAAVGASAIAGQLTLHGQTRPVECTLKETDRARIAEAWLDVRDFGLKPYSAMLGTLKVKPKVQVIVTVRK